MRIIPIMPIESMYGMVYQRAGFLPELIMCPEHWQNPYDQSHS